MMIIMTTNTMINLINHVEQDLLVIISILSASKEFLNKFKIVINGNNLHIHECLDDTLNVDKSNRTE